MLLKHARSDSSSHILRQISPSYFRYLPSLISPFQQAEICRVLSQHLAKSAMGCMRLDIRRSVLYENSTAVPRQLPLGADAP